MIVRGWAVATGLAVLATAQPAAAQEQLADTDLPQVSSPAYARPGPVVWIDEGHGSLQTIAGRYAGFAVLLRADGYQVEAIQGAFDQPGALDDVKVLVVSNPRAPVGSVSAFRPSEIEVLARWVQGGGSLLLAADHAPYGAAAEALGARFGVVMGKGYAFQASGDEVVSNLIYPRQALADHPIIDGLREGEAVDQIQTFTGQSLRGPPGAVVLIAMSSDAREAKDLATLQTIRRRLRSGQDQSSVLETLSRPALPAQGVAFSFGQGRVVFLGEAGMLTAQMVRFDDGRPPHRFGLNTPGHDDQQFALNLLHWLSRLAP